MYACLLFTCGIQFVVLGYDIIKDADSATVSCGADIKMNSSTMVRAHWVDVTFYDLPIKPFEIELDMISITCIQDNGHTRVSFANILLSGYCFLYRFSEGSSNNTFLGLGWFDWLCLAPQCLGNFKIQLPIVRDKLHCYVGEATDYYIGYGKKTIVYTESKAGVRVFVGQFAANISINKPLVKEYIKSDKAYIGTSISWYFVTHTKSHEKETK
jgi:hypothetical protein